MDNPFSSVASDLGRTVAQAKPLLMKLNNADTSTRPSENKWAKKEILGHLLDSASNNHQRFVRAALQGSLTFPGYDQNGLVELQQFREVDWNFLLDFWAAYNRFLAHVINSLPGTAARIKCEKAVEGGPEIEQKLPVHLAELLQLDQPVLIVAGKSQAALKRCANE